VYGSETKNEPLKAGNNPADMIRTFHFHTAQNERLYTAGLRDIVRDRKMMKKAGYIERCGWAALDEHGVPCEIIALHIQGATFGVRSDALIGAVTGGIAARIERIQRNWKDYMEGYAGRVMVSKSGRALNIEFFSGDKFTVSLDAVRDVIVKRARFATIVQIPDRSLFAPQKDHRITEFGEISPHSCQAFEISGKLTA
jgi:hypothetical protein